MSHRVCHLIDANVDTHFFRSIARLHDQERFPVLIGSLWPPGTLQEAIASSGTPTFSLHTSARAEYPRVTLRLANLLRRERVSLLHGHCFDPTFLGLWAARLAGIPFVFTRHHSDHNIRLGKRWHTRIDSWCARRAGHVIAVSQATRRIMMEVERVPGEQISVVYNGMEALRAPELAEVEALRVELGLNGTPVCLVVGRLHEEKGHRVLLDAVPEILRRVGPVRFLVAGEGPDRAELEGRIRAKGLEGTVRLLGRRDDVPALISAATLVVCPSLAESFGYAALEAMSLAKPVVATTAGGLPEVLAHGRAGVLVPPGAAAALADAVCRVLADPAGAARMAEEGRRQAARFTFEQMIRGYEAVYTRVLA